MKKEKIFNLIGMIIGIAAIITGIVLIVAPPVYSTDWVKDASFGADFYTYVYSAARYAANNAADIAHYTKDILSIFGGLSFIFAGLLATLHYAKLFFVTPILVKDERVIPPVRQEDTECEVTSEN